jgi:sialate O-acetylesterase
MLWYQGESNVGNAWQYQALLSAMIRDRRRDFGQNLPVAIVQIAPYRYPDHDPRACPEIWEAELETHRALPNTGLVVTTDLSDVKEIHPQRKQEVGDRLALWALAKVYGHGNIVDSGPIYRSMKIEGDKIRIEFDQVGGGLASRDGKPLSDFSLAGDDQVFQPATARIDGATIVVSSEAVSRPVAVRFGWRDDAQPNLINEEKLPAMPFRSDRWRRMTEPITAPH